MNPRNIATALVVPVACLAWAACGDAPCEETLTCQVEDDDGTGASGPSGSGGMTSTSSGMGGTSTSSAGGADPNDETPPTVLSVTPTDGATGVTDDTKIVITFSEPMDKVTTQAAFQSTDLGTVAFDWLDDSTLEVTSPALAYAQGGASVLANTYSWTLSTGATDLAGNPMVSSRDGSFSTLREVSIQLTKLDDKTRESDGNSNFCVFSTREYLGTTFEGRHCKAMVDYDVTAIPPGVDVTAATLSCSHGDDISSPAPFSMFGGVRLQHVTYTPASYAVGWGTSATTDLGVVYNSILSPPLFNKDVLAALKKVLSTQADRIQFRLQFDNVPSTNPPVSRYISWEHESFSQDKCRQLEVVYLAP